jgi:hypothetical protein
MWPFRTQKSSDVVPQPDRGEVLALELRSVQEQVTALDQEYQQLRFKHFSATRGGHSKLSVSVPAEAQRIMGEVHRILCARDRLKAQIDALQEELARRTVPS